MGWRRRSTVLSVFIINLNAGGERTLLWFRNLRRGKLYLTLSNYSMLNERFAFTECRTEFLTSMAEITLASCLVNVTISFAVVSIRVVAGILDTRSSLRTLFERDSIGDCNVGKVFACVCVPTDPGWGFCVCVCRQSRRLI